MALGRKIKDSLYKSLKAVGALSVIVRMFLRLHNQAYHWVGKLAPFLESDGLHPKHRLMEYHFWFMQHLRPEWTVLDVGCGNGALAYDLKKKCRMVIAIDNNPANVALAQKNYAHEGICYRAADANSYTPEVPIHAIVLSNVLEHIEHREELLLKMASYSGFLLIRVPMFNRDWITLYKKEQGVDWKLDPSHFVEYTVDSLKKELESAGILIVQYTVQFGEIYVVGSTGREIR